MAFFVLYCCIKGTMETSEGGVNVAQLNHGLDAGDFGLSHAMQVPSPIHYIEVIQCL